MEETIMNRCHLAIAVALWAMPTGYVVADNNPVDNSSSCSGLPQHAQLRSALTYARKQANGGFNLDMWGTVVNRDGVVCGVASPGKIAAVSGQAVA